MSSGADQSIVLTGCGWVTSSAAGNISHVLAEVSAGPAPSAGVSNYVSVRPDILAPFGAHSAEVRREEALWMAGAALEIAMADAGVDRHAVASDRVGLVLGCALAGQSGMIDFANDVREQSARFVSPIRFPQTVGNYVSGALARAYDLRGPASTLARGSASSLDALVEGTALLTSGTADLVIAGGSEKLSAKLVEGLYDRAVVFADGACLFILERADHAAKRGKKPLGTMLGVKNTAQSKRSLVSTAGVREPGAVFIETWIGRTLGADAAAALAAAIGRAAGMRVPIAGEGPAALYSSESALPGTDIVIRAMDDNGYRSEFSVVPATSQ